MADIDMGASKNTREQRIHSQFGHIQCIQCAYSVYTVCIHCVYRVYTVYTVRVQCVYSAYTVCIQYVYRAYTVCTHFVRARGQVNFLRMHFVALYTLVFAAFPRFNASSGRPSTSQGVCIFY